MKDAQNHPTQAPMTPADRLPARTILVKGSFVSGACGKKCVKAKSVKLPKNSAVRPAQSDLPITSHFIIGMA